MIESKIVMLNILMNLSYRHVCVHLYNSIVHCTIVTRISLFRMACVMKNMRQ